jgi:transposase-like protein
MMRYAQAEKLEIIRLVESSDLSVKQTLQELDVPRSTFYRWYQCYQEDGYDGLADAKPQARQFWNRIPDRVRDEVVDLALTHPEESSRQLAWRYTDEESSFISESSVYRILKGYDLITSPVFHLVSAKDRYDNPTKRINEMWQTDFTYFKVVGWGWYYLCTVLDDFSRYILAWRLSDTMGSEDVQATLDLALEKAEITQVKLKHRPRLLSDNGPGFVAEALQTYLERQGIRHIRGAPYHPQTQGKIERWHRSMKNVVKLDTYYFPWELEHSITGFVHYYNDERYHESLQNLRPTDVYFGRSETILARREVVKQNTLRLRKEENLTIAIEPWNPVGSVLPY